MGSYSDYKESSIYVRLKEGENRVRIVTEPYFVKKSFKEGEAPKERFAWVVLDRSDGEVRYLSVGPQIMGQVVALVNDEDYGDPKKYDLKIRREGASWQDTRYQVIPGPKTPLTAGEKSKVKEFKIDFPKVCGGEDIPPSEIPDNLGEIEF